MMGELISFSEITSGSVQWKMLRGVLGMLCALFATVWVTRWEVKGATAALFLMFCTFYIADHLNLLIRVVASQ